MLQPQLKLLATLEACCSKDVRKATILDSFAAQLAADLLPVPVPQLPLLLEVIKQLPPAPAPADLPVPLMEIIHQPPPAPAPADQPESSRAALALQGYALPHQRPLLTRRLAKVPALPCMHAHTTTCKPSVRVQASTIKLLEGLQAAGVGVGWVLEHTGCNCCHTISAPEPGPGHSMVWQSIALQGQGCTAALRLVSC